MMTDTTIRVGRTVYNIVVYALEHGYRAEAARGGRVIEVVDAPRKSEAWRGIRVKLEKRNGR